MQLIITRLLVPEHMDHSISEVLKAVGFPQASVSSVLYVNSDKTTATRGNYHDVRVDDRGRQWMAKMVSG